MGEYVLPEHEANSMRYNCDVANEIDKMLSDNNMISQYKEQSSKTTIILKKEHLPVIDGLMLHCIAVLHGPKNDE